MSRPPIFKFYWLIFTLLAQVSLKAQDYKFEWVRADNATNQSFAYSLATDPLGNVYTAGEFGDTLYLGKNPRNQRLISKGLGDIYIHKMDEQGNLIWAKSFGSKYHERAPAVCLDQQQNILVTGTFHDTLDADPNAGKHELIVTHPAKRGDVYIIKLDSSGKLIWARSFGDTMPDRVYSITTDADDNVYVTGQFHGTVDFDPGPSTFYLSTNGAGCYLLKLNSKGDFIWARNLEATSFSTSYSVNVDVNSDVYIAGFYKDTLSVIQKPDTPVFISRGAIDFFVQKLDSNGKLLWVKSIGGVSDDLVHSLVSDPSGNVYLVGGFNGEVDFDPGPAKHVLKSQRLADVFVLKLSSKGEFIWAKSFGGQHQEYGAAVTLDRSNNLVIIGNFSVPVDFDPGYGVYTLNPNGGDIFIQKINSNGEFIWAKSIGSKVEDWPSSITLDKSNNLFITGAFRATMDFDPNHGVYNLQTRTTNGFVLKLSPCKEQEVTDTINSCQPYKWIDDKVYFKSNYSASVTLKNERGCDSIVRLHLNIHKPTDGTDHITSCTPVQWIDGNTYTQSNHTATYRLKNQWGCDSIVTLNLTITPKPEGTDRVTACDSFQWIDGVTYYTSNSSAQQLIKTDDLCDSVSNLALTVHHSDYRKQAIIACNSYTWIDGNTYDSSNFSAKYVLVNQFGCDSTIELDLTIHKTTERIDRITACDSFTWVDGKQYDQSTTAATVLMPNSMGCDSILWLDLTIHKTSFGRDIQSACDSYTWIDGNTYTSSNQNAVHVLTNKQGCDSLVTLNLEIRSSSEQIDTQYACHSYTWIDGNTYTKSNNWATHHLKNSNGCDSLIRLNLEITGIDPNVKVYPNPSNGLVNINFGNLNRASLEIHNVRGQLIYHQKAIQSNKHTVLMDVAAGVYFAKISSQCDEQVFKILIQ